jgi:hypothetical protein
MPDGLYTKKNDIEIIDIILRSRMGAKFSLIGLYTELTIFESIFESTLTGRIDIGDGANLVGHFPIIGQEYIDVIYRTPGVQTEYTTHTFDVYEVSPRVRGNPGDAQGEVYTLFFASPEFISNQQMKCNRSYTGTVGNIVATIMTNNFAGSLSTLEVQNTRNDIRFIAPYWSPFKCIQWLAKRALPAVSETNNRESNYLFYQTLDSDFGEYHFKSISSLVNKSPVASYHLSVGDQQQIDSPKQFGTSLTAIESYSNLKYANKFEEVQTGMMASTLFTHDITFKKFDVSSYSYGTDFHSASHVNDYPIMPINNDGLSPTTDAVIHYKPKQNEMYIKSAKKDEKELPIDNFFYEDWLLDRKSLLEQIRTQEHKIIVSGNTGVHAGDMVSISIPTTEVHTDESSGDDKNLSGKFLIHSIRHIINNNDGHRMQLAMSRDSLQEQVPDESKFLGDNTSISLRSHQPT